MKLRNGLILLLILALVSAILPASAENTDFPFLPGMGWNSTVAEMENAVGVKAEDQNQTLGNSGRIIYFKPTDSGLAPVPYELAMTTSASNAITMVIFLYDLSATADKDAARGQIADEVDKLYGGRGTLLFDSPESMRQAFADKDGLTDLMMATSLGGLEGAVSDMYEDMDQVALAKGWLVDRKYAAMVSYSTKGSNADRVAVLMLNVEQTISIMSNQSAPESRTGCFDLPAGVTWMSGTDVLGAALTKAGITYSVDGDLYQTGLLDGPGGTSMTAIYMFENGRLMGMAYTIFAGYDELEQLMIREYGASTDVDTEQIKSQVESILGVPAIRACVWIDMESLKYLIESAQGCFVLQVSTQMLMEQQ